MHRNICNTTCCSDRLTGYPVTGHLRPVYLLQHVLTVYIFREIRALACFIFKYACATTYQQRNELGVGIEAHLLEGFQILSQLQRKAGTGQGAHRGIPIHYQDMRVRYIIFPTNH